MSASANHTQSSSTGKLGHLSHYLLPTSAQPLSKALHHVHTCPCDQYASTNLQWISTIGTYLTCKNQITLCTSTFEHVSSTHAIFNELHGDTAHLWHPLLAVWWQRKSTGVHYTVKIHGWYDVISCITSCWLIFCNSLSYTIYYIHATSPGLKIFSHTWTCQRLKLHKPASNLPPNNPSTTEHQNSTFDDTSCYNSGFTECCSAVSTELEWHKSHIMMSLPHLVSLNTWDTCCVFCPRSTIWHWWSSAFNKFN